MTLASLLRVLRLRWGIPVGATVVAVGVAAALSWLTVPVYSATATIRVAQAQSGTVQYGDFLYADRLTNTYARMALSSSVLDQVIQRLKLAVSSQQLAKQVEVKPLADTELMTISVENPDPDMAVSIAGVVADVITQQNTQLYFGGTKSAADIVADEIQSVETDLTARRAAAANDPGSAAAASQDVATLEQTYTSLLKQYEDLRTTEALRANSVSLVEPPSRPVQPTKPNWPVNLGLAFFIGLLGGAGLAFALEALDRQVRDIRQLSHELNLSVMGTVPWTHAPLGPELLVTAKPTKDTVAAAEAYRFIQFSLQALPHDTCRSLVITSAQPGEGKSTITANLAIAIAQSGRRVLLVDGDFRRPSLHRLFGIPNGSGFGDVVSGHADPESVIIDSQIPNLRLLTAGPEPWRPSGSLGSALMNRAVDKLLAEADLVLFDTPPVLAIADTMQLAYVADQVALVVRQGHVPSDRVAEAVERLRTAKGDPLGIIGVLNVSAANHPYAAYAQSALEATA